MSEAHAGPGTLLNPLPLAPYPVSLRAVVQPSLHLGEPGPPVLTRPLDLPRHSPHAGTEAEVQSLPPGPQAICLSPAFALCSALEHQARATSRPFITLAAPPAEFQGFSSLTPLPTSFQSFKA